MSLVTHFDCILILSQVLDAVSALDRLIPLVLAASEKAAANPDDAVAAARLAELLDQLETPLNTVRYLALFLCFGALSVLLWLCVMD